MTTHESDLSAGDDERGFGVLETARGALPLEAMDVRARIVGLAAHTIVRQTFVNGFDVPLEASYIFPLPDRAAVSAFRLDVAGRSIDSQLVERGEARQRYDEAIERGERAATAEEERPGVFTTRVGNLRPGERATVTLTLTGLCGCAGGEASYRFPLVVAPRYIPGCPLPGPSVGEGHATDTDQTPDASRVTPPALLAGWPSPVRLALSVVVSGGGLPLGDLRVSLHDVDISDVEPGVRRVSLRPGARLDRDFILRYRIDAAGDGLTLAIAPDDNGAEGSFVLTLVPPRATAARTPRDVVMVIDRSGSMAGWKMVAARRGLARMIETLDDKDRFAVLAFDNVIERPAWMIGQSLLPATDRNRFRAVEFVSRVESRGGTELADALVEAARLIDGAASSDGARAATIVLVTDGQVGNEDQLLGKLAPHLPRMRLLCLGIDEAVNGALLTRLAQASGGHAELVESEDRLDEVMDRLRALLGAGVLERITLALDGAAVVAGTLAPARIPDLCAGQALLVTGRYRGAVPTGARLDAIRSDGRATTLRATAQRQPGEVVTHVCARALVRELEDRYAIAVDQELERRIVETSLRFGVLSRFTAFVAVDHGHVAVNEPLHRVVQPVETPRGWAVGGGGYAPPSRPGSSDSMKTRAGVVMGSPHALSPEQARGLGPMAASDVFSLAVLIYRLLEGKHLFDGAGFAEVLIKIIRGQLPARLFAGAELAPVEELLRKALVVDPQARFGDAARFADALAAARAALPPATTDLASMMAQAFASERGAHDAMLAAAAKVAAGADEYVLCAKLGEGATSVAYLAAWRRSDGTPDLALLELASSGDVQTIEQYLAETRLVHPAIVEVYETGVSGNDVFQAFHFAGRDLDALLARAGRLPAPVALALGERLARALAFAHRAGVVHAQVDAEHVVISDSGEARLRGFGPAPVRSLRAPASVRSLRRQTTPPARTQSFWK